MKTLLAIIMTIVDVSLVVFIASLAIITFVVAWMAIKYFIEEL